MESVILEKRFDPPVLPAEFAAHFSSVAPCFRLHMAEHRRAHIALDGTDVVCLFRAPDAESVRLAMRQMGERVERIWSASVHAPTEVDDPLTEVILVERSFTAPVDFEHIQTIENRGAWCLEAHAVRFVRTYFSFDRQRMLCLYRAPDAESVRLAQTGAGLPFDRVWAARIVDDE